MRSFVDKLVRTESRETPWRLMSLSAIATAVPLLIGLILEQPTLAIYGALVGYLISLNDHLGSLRHRLWVATFTFLLLIAGFLAGAFLKGHETTFQIYFAIVVYWLGVLGGEGGELERGALFATLGTMIAHVAPAIPEEFFDELLLFAGAGYGALIVATLGLHAWLRRPPNSHSGLRDSFRKSFTTRLDRHIHAGSYALTALSSIWLSDFFSLERGYWVTITLLLIMRPDRAQSFYRTLHRLIGTASAVFLFTPASLLIQSASVYAGLAVVSVFAVPWALRRNYLQASFFITVFVFCLLEIVAPQHSDRHLPWVRLHATLLGCGLSLVGSAFSSIWEAAVRRPRYH